MAEIHLDIETRSAADLRKVGMYVYAEHPTTDVWCACWCVDDGPINTWLMGDPPPRVIGDYLAEGAVIVAHNAGFEHAHWQKILTPRYGWPAVTFEQFRCTAAMAAAMALPRDLAGAAEAMGQEAQKDMAGKRIMMQLSRPRRVEQDGTVVWWTPQDSPKKFEALYAYCVQDVEVERGLTKRLRPLSAFEHDIWQLDHKINTRGVQVDLEMVGHAERVVTLELARLNREMETLTHGQVTKVSQVTKLNAWLREQGMDIESLDKHGIRAALAAAPNPRVRRVLELRQEGAKSSTAKLDAMKLRTSADNRARENLMYHGASTGRWSGKGIQLQNLPRPSLKAKQIEQVFEALPARDPGFLTVWGSPLAVVSDCLRGMVTAAPGHHLVRADYSNIEGRVLAWLAGDEKKLDRFRAYDTILGYAPDGKPIRKGPDIYKVAAAGIFGCDVEDIDDKRRQVGKVSELAQGYQGGHGAWISMGKNYAIAPADVVPAVRAATDYEAWATAADGWSAKNRYGLPQDEWTALRIVIDGWRGAHPEIVAYWDALDAAAMRAVRSPGEKQTVGGAAFVYVGNILWCRLPSGRLLAYVDARLREVETPWGGTRLAVTYMGVDSVTRRWSRHKAYGGHWAENITQAVARDIMADAMLRVEARGWPVVLTVHDEIVCEVPAGSVDAETFGEEVRLLPPWASGLPVTAEGVVGFRYGK